MGRYRVFSFHFGFGKKCGGRGYRKWYYDLRLENDVLKFSEDQVLYRDQPIQGGRFKPVAFQAEHRFYCEDGKLHYEYDGRCFDVDANQESKQIKKISALSVNDGLGGCLTPPHPQAGKPNERRRL